MALYWTIRSLPELGHLSERDRHHLLRRCGTSRFYFSMILRSFVIAMLAASFCAAATVRDIADASVIFSVGVGVLAFIGTYQWFMRIIRADVRLALVKGFAGERLPVCLRCGYNLTGTEGDICPECGGQIKVRGSRSADDDDEDDDAAVH